MSVASDPAPPLPVSAPRRRKPGPWRLDNIIDGRALRVKLTAAALDCIGNAPEARRRVVDLLHGALFRGRLIAQERLQQGADGLDTARLLSAVQDEVIGALYDFVTTHVFRARNPTEAERLAICASGGYGRGVLAPSSDIDLLILHSYKKSAHAESVVEYMLYALWDMGLKVGHAFRTPRECERLAATDVTIKTSLLDMRFIAGDEALFDETRAVFHERCVRGQDAAFIADKLAERDARHARQGDSRYVVEPNVKEGKGGLRDLQTLYWIIKHMNGGESLEDVMRTSAFTREDYRRYIRAARFFWTVRCHLHYLTGRAEERLSFDLQPEIAARMGYTDRGERLGVERFMKRYFLVAKDVGNLTRVLAAKLEAEHKKRPEGLRRLVPKAAPKPVAPGFVSDGGRISIESEDIFARDPVQMIRLFVVAEREAQDIHPDALWAISRHLNALSPDLRKTGAAREAFLDALLAGERPGATLKRMNEAGVLGRMVPEFGGIVAQTQFNMYHHFTVDEHTLRAVETISDIEHGRFESATLPTQLFEQIVSRRALYLAMLLHDTGKGRGDQQVEGEKTARRACRRLGLDMAETELVAWLVRHHLDMSDTAQKRDVSDPRTVSRFAALVGDLERLRLLYILTVADINAVGPGVWNAWKGQLLADLYHNTVAALRGDRSDEGAVRAVLEERAETRREALLDRLGQVPARMVKMETAYWTGFDVDDLAWHASHLETGQDQDVVVATQVRTDRGGVVLFVSGRDRIGLFADMVGAIAAAGASIVSAQVFTSGDGEFVDVFVLQSPRGGLFAEGAGDRLARLERDVAAAVQDGADDRRIKTRRERREAAFIVEPVVQIRNDVSTQFTVIEVTGRDRQGLLYDVARVFAAHELSIHSAHVGSYGERVFDAFYVQTPTGRKLSDASRKARLRRDLLALLGRDEPVAPHTPARELRRASAVDSF